MPAIATLKLIVGSNTVYILMTSRTKKMYHTYLFVRV
jgi:hypothetical protein